MRGMMLLESDDGFITDYNSWYPHLQSDVQKTKFYPFEFVVSASFAVNTLSITNGAVTHMSIAQVQELANYGCEIMAHGRTHVGLGTHALLSAVSAGATTIDVTRRDRIRTNANLVYEIKEGATSENFVVSSRGEPGAPVDGEIILETALTNSYTTNATVSLTQASMEWEILGSKTDIESWGIAVMNYVPAFYALNTQSRAIIEANFDSMCVSATTDVSFPLIDPATINLHNLPRYNLAMSTEDISTLIELAYATNKILILPGHGDHPAKVKHAVEKALETGVRIVTRSQMLHSVGN